MRESWFTTTPALVGVVFFAFFCNLWGIPLFDLDEGAFAEATREMLASGNWAATYLDGAPRYDKPILSYWFQGLSVTLLGQSEFTFRLPSAIAASLWLFTSYRFAREFWDEKTARFTLLIMATTFWVGMIGRAAIADAWLNLFISLTIFDIWRYRQKPVVGTLLRVYLWMALGMLTKGPVAIIIPLLTSLIAFAWEGNWRLWFRAVFSPLGWCVLLAVLSPWLLLVYQDQGAEFFKGFLLEHNLNRFSKTKEGHGGQIYYFILVLPLILLPFTGPLFKTIAKTKGLFQQPLERFLLIWFAVVFVLVSVSQTQLPHYVLYGISGLLMIFAAHRQQLFQGQWQLAIPIIFFALLTALPQLVELASSQSHRAYEKEMLAHSTEAFGLHYYVAIAILLAGSFFFILQRHLSPSMKLITLGFLQTLFVFNVLMESVSEIRQEPVRQAAKMARLHPSDKVIAYKIRMPSFSVYRQAITPKRPPQSGDLIFTRSDRLPQLKQDYSTYAYELVYSKGGIVLVEVKDETHS